MKNNFEMVTLPDEFVSRDAVLETEKHRKQVKQMLLENENLKLSQDYQDYIATTHRELLSLIPNITLNTILTFCGEGKGSFRIHFGNTLVQEDIQILFETYKQQIKPQAKEYCRNKELKILLLSIIKKEDILEMDNSEILEWYHAIISNHPLLDDEDYKQILVKNPLFIEYIEDQSEELQLAAFNNNYCNIDVLKYIKNPTDKVYATILAGLQESGEWTFNEQLKGKNPSYRWNPKLPKYIYTKSYSKHPYFNKLVDGVSENIMDMVIEMNPSCAFLKGFFHKECTPQQKEKAISVNPYKLFCVPKEELTEEFVLTAIKSEPKIIEYIGTHYDLYYVDLAIYAYKVLCSKTCGQNTNELRLLECQEIVEYRGKCNSNENSSEFFVKKIGTIPQN